MTCIPLLAGASVVALVAAGPNAGGADLSSPTVKKAPPPPAAIVKERWTWWIEGGAFGTGGGDVNFAGPLGMRPNWGAEGAVGFDWQPQTFQSWHLSGQFRYGSAAKGRLFGVTAAGTVGGTAFSGAATGNEHLREDHWLVDFAVGRDFGLGNSNAQRKFGLHIADLRAKLTANGFFAGTFSHSATATPFTLVEKSSSLRRRAAIGRRGLDPARRRLEL